MGQGDGGSGGRRWQAGARGARARRQPARAGGRRSSGTIRGRVADHPRGATGACRDDGSSVVGPVCVRVGDPCGPGKYATRWVCSEPHQSRYHHPPKGSSTAGYRWSRSRTPTVRSEFAGEARVTADPGGWRWRPSGCAKKYGSQVALDGLDLRVPTGVVYGFLGPNGAGKTTTMRILTGLIRPDSGHVELLGRPFGRGDRRAPVRGRRADRVAVVLPVPVGPREPARARGDRGAGAARRDRRGPRARQPRGTRRGQGLGLLARA